MAQWNQCFYCGCHLIFTKKDHQRQRTVDHVTPRSSGGDKFVDSCKRCNNLKGQSNIEDFREWMKLDKFYGELRGWEPW